MQTLEPPHSHFLSAAEGWLGLGDVAEARVELERIDESLRDHPAVMDVHWAILAQEKNWAEALVLARRYVKLFPEDPSGWLHQAYAIRRAPKGGLQAAWKCLLPALDRFPEVSVIPYNLACYACLLGEEDRSVDLLKQ